ncbi:transcription factor RFX4 [Caerostris extrusa]|uniref:Transcription factor RFX4 n=1 Tax=Caerostris extrusa TaxID=172846 RepID=A0AAV4NYC0_CAEEX|nr:transcription factor RFX4 [Caerostris extrusa]
MIPVLRLFLFRYHYYGIAIRKALHTSKYPFRRREPRVPPYQPRVRTGTVLPEFPSIKDLNLPPTVDIDKMGTFLMMYRTHCQRLLDTIVRANFDDGTEFPVTFLARYSSSSCTSFRIECSDKSSGSLTKIVRKFAEEVDSWLKVAIGHLPNSLKIVKLEIGRDFETLLEEEAPIENYIEWLEALVNKCAVHAAGRRKGAGRRLARSFHLLRLMFDDYVLFLVETIHTEDQMKDFMRNLMNDTPPQITSFSDYQALSNGTDTEHLDSFTLHSNPGYGPCSSESPTAHYEGPPSEDLSSGWMHGDCYQGIFYPSSNSCDSRRSWNPSTRHDNKGYNYQQTAQYLILSQDDTMPMQPTQHSGYDEPYNRPEDNSADQSGPSSIMYTTSGAIYQSYTFVTHDAGTPDTTPPLVPDKKCIII